jgi:uncharacterized protein (TIRG00374 family)
LKRRRLLELFGALLFAVLLVRLGLGRSLDALLHADAGALGLAILAFLLSQAVRVAKWRYFYRIAGVPYGFVEGARFYFDLKLLGTLTPGRVGEFLPAAGAPERQGALLSCAAFDRLAESMATALLAAGASAFLLGGRGPGGTLAWSLAFVAAIALVGLACARNAWMTWLWERALRLLGRRSRERRGETRPAAERIGEEVARLRESLRLLIRPRAVAVAGGVTALAVAADVLFWWLTFRSVGIDLRAGILLASIAVFNMTGFFSPTPAGLGVSDTAFVVFLRSAGADGPFGTFLILLRLIVVALTALSAWGFAILGSSRGVSES